MEIDMNLYAREFAISAHGDQKYGEEGYVYHLDQVAKIASRFFDDSGIDSVLFDDVINIAYLHDVLEDTPTTYEEIYRSFGWDTAQNVYYLTDAPGKTRAERKLNSWHKIRSSKISRFVKLCDRLANTYEGGKIEMYRKEFPLFEAALYIPGDMDIVWDRLRVATFNS